MFDWQYHLAVAELRKLVAHYSQDGNWNYDPHLFGVANGVRLALAIVTRQKPEYLDAPKEWLHDKLPSATRKEITQ